MEISWMYQHRNISWLGLQPIFHRPEKGGAAAVLWPQDQAILPIAYLRNGFLDLFFAGQDGFIVPGIERRIRHEWVQGVELPPSSRETTCWASIRLMKLSSEDGLNIRLITGI